MSSSRSINQQGLNHLALLARIQLTETQKKVFLEQISSIFNYLDILTNVDTANIIPTFQVTDLKNVFREDQVDGCLSQSEALRPASKTKDGYFMVKSTIKK